MQLKCEEVKDYRKVEVREETIQRTIQCDHGTEQTETKPQPS